MKLKKVEREVAKEHGRSRKEKCKWKDKQYSDDMVENLSTFLERDIGNQDLRWVVEIQELVKNVDGSLAVWIRATMAGTILDPE
ncbi:hypothetical protein SUGI_0465000 [Cryptomeria japonica]|nr:hypothetical protein SUGI_0465000 [Cryptomeria japonica]